MSYESEKRIRKRQKQSKEITAQLPACDNVGISGDDRDLYHQLGQLLTTIEENSLPFACKAGCAKCCYAPFMVTSLEWQVLYPYLLSLPAEKQQPIITMAESARCLEGQFVQFRADRMKPFSGRFGSTVQMQCAFLVGGQCAVYPARPLVCRAYGYTSMKTDDPNGPAYRMGACHLAQAHVQLTWPEDERDLPLFDPYMQRRNEMNKDQDGSLGYLIQWLWAHIQDGKLIPEINLHPFEN